MSYDYCGVCGSEIEVRHGITKREYFAAMADISMDDAEGYVRKHGNHSPTIGDIINARVELKYFEADAMLTESEKDGNI